MSGKVINFPGKPCSVDDLDWVRENVTNGEILGYAVAVVWADGCIGTVHDGGEHHWELAGAVGQLQYRMQSETI
jgi:hypothetical protein